MTDNRALPLHVYQVLEEEYVSLYGPISASETIWVQLPDDTGEGFRDVAARLDWGFLSGHVRSASNFASDVLEEIPDDSGPIVSDSRAPQAYDWAKNNLKRYLRQKPDGGLLRRLADAPDGRPDPADVALLEGEGGWLNGLLADENLYNSDRFADGWLSEAARGMVRMHTSRTPGPFGGEALRHFNRMLLEDAFPDFIEPLKNIRLAAIYRRLHEVKPTALSLSGGGIRSGTFALGLIQGLARHKLLQRFDYLSTVSGGGYIGSWLSAWLHRHPQGLAGVTRELANVAPASKIDPDPRPLQHLRSYSNFLTPKAGLLTADTWSFIGIYLRNLLLNWMVFIPLLLALLMLPRLLVGVTLWQPVGEPRALGSPGMTNEQLETVAEGLSKVPEALRVTYGPASQSLFGLRIYPRHVALLLGFALGVWALAYVIFNRPGVREMLRRRSRFWRDRTDQKSFLIYCLVPLLLSALCLTTYWAWSRELRTDEGHWKGYIFFGVAFTLAAWLVASAILGRFRRLSEVVWMEVFLLAVVGAAGGAVFWLLSYQTLLGDPVVGYGVVLREGKVVQAPIEWTSWGAWLASRFSTELYVCLGVPVFLLTFWLAVSLFVGLSSKLPKVEDEDREWWARFGAWLLISVIAWVAFNAVVIFAPLALIHSPKMLASIGGISGLIAVLAGRSAGTPASGKKSAEAEKTKTGALVGVLTSSLSLLAVVFLALLLALLSLATTGITRGAASASERLGAGGSLGEWMTNVPERTPGAPWYGFPQYLDFTRPVVTATPEKAKPAATPSMTPAPAPGATPTPQVSVVYVARDSDDAKKATRELSGEDKGDLLDPYTGAKLVHMNVLHHTSLGFSLALLVLLGGFGLVMSWLINLNKFSLHGGYRNRMIRAFLGASRPHGERRPNPFTGFDPADNLHMHEMRWALFSERDFVKPEELAAALAGDGAAGNPVSKYLAEKGLTKRIHEAADKRSVQGLLRALRTELNAVLEGEALYTKGAVGSHFLQRPRAVELLERIRKSVNEATRGTLTHETLEGVQLRSDYHLLLNRLVLEEAYPEMIKFGQPPPYKLMHVVNTTLNLVGGDKLAWQQRKAEPFSVSPLHSGCFRLGYRDSRTYGGAAFNGISIGTAAAISGAAASSNMGYFTTSPAISLLLTFFNVRLGWWLGNPGTAGQDTYQLSAPTLSVKPVVAEAFGMTDDRHAYVYLTDGGHFENLALYEMVLRRCHVIVVSDGGEDREFKFGDLGSAVRKIRIDLGVEIDFPCVPIYSKEAAEDGKKKGSYWAVGRIRYSRVDRVPLPGGGFGAAQDGVLIYVKPTVYGREPRDVLEYRESNPAFPHQSTGDQFFDEPQFESYRSLGLYIAGQLCGAGSPADLVALAENAYKKLEAACVDYFDADFKREMDDWFRRKQ